MQLFYRVREGDTLTGIAKRWELPVKSLIAANHLRPPYTLEKGQQLAIPPGVNRYRVQTGDSIYRMSQFYGVPIAAIAEANGLEPPYLLRVGQLVEIPTGVPFYVVQSGDTLGEIAERYNVMTDGRPNLDVIRQTNRLSSDTVTPGMQVAIPYAPTGDEGFIAYTSDRGGQFDIWTLHLRNGEHKRLTTDLADSFSVPVWSPDGSRIAFVGKEAIVYVIYVASGLIAGIDQLAEGGDFHLDWSSDSVELAYTARGTIMLYNTTVHEGQTVDQPGASDVNWFPSGTELLFQALDASGISQLYRCSTDGTDKRQLTTNTAGPLHDIRLSPDGRFVLYTTPGASISILYTSELSTGNVVEVKGGPLAKNYYPEWSHDSSHIAFSATSYEDRGYFSQIRTVGKRGGDERIWAIANCFSTPVSWSPDSKKIAYLAGCQEQQFANEMWIVDTGHPVPIQLVSGVNMMALQWSPRAIMELSKKEYSNEQFDVSFQYPANWQRVNDERYEGDDGFFQISALFGSQQIEEVCHAEAFQQEMPYGTKPQIIPSENVYEQACTILPSADQPTDMNGQAAYIAKYPNPITISGKTFNYFIIWGDQNHIQDIASTILFLP